MSPCRQAGRQEAQRDGFPTGSQSKGSLSPLHTALVKSAHRMDAVSHSTGCAGVGVTAQDKACARAWPAGRTLCKSCSCWHSSVSSLVAVCENGAGGFAVRTTAVGGAQTCPFPWSRHSPTACFAPAAASAEPPQEFEDHTSPL